MSVIAESFRVLSYFPPHYYFYSGGESPRQIYYGFHLPADTGTRVACVE